MKRSVEVAAGASGDGITSTIQTCEAAIRISEPPTIAAPSMRAWRSSIR